MLLPPKQRRGVCMMPAPDGGQPCSGRKDCNIVCECPSRTEALEDGSRSEGVCATFPFASGSGWHCIVENGRLVRQGMIVD